MTDTPQSPNYQDILTKYADSLKSTEIPPIPNEESKMDPKIQLESVPEPEKVESAPLVTPTMLEPDPGAELEPEIEPVSAVMMEADSKTEVIPSSDLSTPMPEVKDQYIAPPTEPTEPIEPEPKMDFPSEVTQIPESDITTEAPIIPPPPPVGYPNIAPDFVPPKENHFFKYLFFFSLVVFIVVAGLVVVSFLDSQKTLTESKNTPTSVPPTGVDVVGCEINGKKYSFGESFKADDGCNTCSCGEDKQIACTLMACESSTSASPTKSATTSAIPTDWKVYTNSSYSFKYPSKWNLVDLTKGLQVEIYYQPDKTKSVGEILVENMGLSMKGLDTYTKSKSIGGLNAKCNVGTQMITWCYLVSDKKEYISFTITEDKNADYNMTLDQILSTFEFTKVLAPTISNEP